jgi:hypothetical protein
MWEWIKRWLNTPTQPRLSPLELLLQQQAETTRELLSALRRRDEQIDRVLVARFDRPQVSQDAVPQDARLIPASMFTDVLNAPTDAEFLEMAREMTQQS